MKRLTLAFLFAAAACARPTPAPVAAAAPAASATRHTFLMASNKAGAQVATRDAGGALVYDFEFNDRGRGPKTRTVLRVDPRGVPLSLHTTGNDYFKGPVDEVFKVEGDRATWVNKAEKGEGAAGGFYVSMYGPPEEMAQLARALLAAPDNRLKLLPSGEASLDRIGSMEVEANGRRMTVHHYAIRGLSLVPVDIWLDSNDELFFSGSAWAATVREGWESTTDKLIKRQDEVSTARLGEIAKRHARRYDAIAIRNARLFDAETATARDGITILIRGNQIAEVGPNVAVPPDAHVLDASGRTVIPGLWDMHVHSGDVDGILHMAAGVTSARDLANDIDTIVELRRKINDGTLIGPRLVLAGFLDGPGPYAGPTKVLVATDEEARAAIDKYSLGYEQVKIYSSIRPELVEPIVRYAHSKGLRVSGHIPAYMRAEEAVRAGYDEIQHANMLFLNFFPDVQDTRTPLRFTAVAERGATLDLSSPEVRSFVRLLKERGTVVDPTVSIFEQMFVDRPGEMAAGLAAIADRLPPQLRRGFLSGGLPVPDGMDARYRQSFEQMLRFVRLLYDEGVTIVPGTDGFPGFLLHRELENYVRAGIPAPKVLQIATIGSARVAKRDGKLGSIVPGKLADLAIVAGDPTTNISDIRNVETVIQDGVVFSSRDLYSEVGIR